MTLTLLLLIALATVTLLRVSDKHKVSEWYEVNRRAWMPRPCRFCYTFWIGVTLFSLYEFTPNSLTKWAFYLFFILAVPTVVSYFLFIFSHDED